MNKSMKLFVKARGIAMAILITVLTTAGSFAQDFEGKVVYGLTYNNLPDEMAGYESMLPKQMTMYFKQEKSRIEQDLGMAGTQIIVSDSKTEDAFILMDLMGQKMCLTIDPADKEEAEDVKPKVKKLSETKKIAGYKCKAAEVTYPGGEGEEDQVVIVYYTPKISGDGHNQFSMLDGLPLEYTTSQQGMEVTIVAELVSEESVAASYFDAPEEYKKMTMDEFQQMMGGGQ